MAKLSRQKAGLSNAFVEMRARATEIESALKWQAWEDATERGFIKRRAMQYRLDTIRGVMVDLESLVSGKRVRKDGRKSETGSRLLLAVCTHCEYRIRLSAMCAMMGVPKCPVAHCEVFEQEPLEVQWGERGRQGEYEENMTRENAGLAAVGFSNKVAEVTHADPFADLPDAGDLDKR